MTYEEFEKAARAHFNREYAARKDGAEAHHVYGLKQAFADACVSRTNTLPSYSDINNRKNILYFTPTAHTAIHTEAKKAGYGKPEFDKTKMVTNGKFFYDRNEFCTEVLNGRDF